MSNFNYGNSGGGTEIPEFNTKRVRNIIVAVVLLIAVIWGFSKSFIILEPTEKGVIFYRWGNGLDVDKVYSEGLNVMAPWNEMKITDVSEQQVTEEMQVLSKDGLNIKVEVTIRYKPKEDLVGYLFKSFREDYDEKLVKPELRSAVRSVIGNYQPEELYSTKRTEIEAEINRIVAERYDENYVELRALLLRKIELPATLVSAIEEKLTAEQRAQKYVYILQQEQKEAERKTIEARGAKLANAILDSSLTPNLLKMRGIEATLKLAESPNSKVVVVGGGDEGLPLILGNQ